jgi:hypothetical protein
VVLVERVCEGWVWGLELMGDIWRYWDGQMLMLGRFVMGALCVFWGGMFGVLIVHMD